MGGMEIATVRETGATLVLREGPAIPEAPAGDFSADQQPLPASARSCLVSLCAISRVCLGLATIAA